MIKKSKQIKILRIIYLRMMRLKFGSIWLHALRSSMVLDIECPDMVYCLSWSFVTDAYITIDAVFGTGRQSFRALCDGDREALRSLDDVRYKIEQLLPGFHNVRNNSFAHFNDPQNPDICTLFFKRSEEVMCVVLRFHQWCCDRFDVSPSDIGGYDAGVFEKFYDQVRCFSNFVLAGYLKIKGDEVLNNCSYFDDSEK